MKMNLKEHKKTAEAGGREPSRTSNKSFPSVKRGHMGIQACLTVFFLLSIFFLLFGFCFVSAGQSFKILFSLLLNRNTLS